MNALCSAHLPALLLSKVPVWLVAASVTMLFGLAAPPVQGAPLTPGNVLVIQGEFDPNPNVIREFTPAGVLVQTLVVPNPTPGRRTDSIHDAAVTADGRLAIYDGTVNPFLNVLDPATGMSQSYAFPGWSTAGSLNGGGIATLGNIAFATDVRTFTSELHMRNGLIRFDTVTGAGQRFASGTDFSDVAVGLDRLIYAVPGPTSPQGVEIYVYDPVTLQELRRVVLSGAGENGVFAVAINDAGEIFAGSGNFRSSISFITRHAPNGQFLGALTLPGTGIVGLDLDGSGNVVGISADGRVFLTTEALTSFTTLVNVGGGADRNVTFVPSLAGTVIPEPASLTLAALGLAGLAGYRWRRRKRAA